MAGYPGTMARRQMPDRGSGYDQTVLGVFPTVGAADAAAGDVARVGIPGDRIHVDEGRDEVVAMRAEMREEIEHTVIGPGPVGPATKEMTKGLRLSFPVGIIIGALLVLPFGFIPFGGLSLYVRLIIAVVVGAVAGLSVALVLGGGLGAKDPEEPLAAERGITVRVEARTPDEGRQIADLMTRHAPIRVDLMTAFDQPAHTVATEEDRD
jgi:hypothetical protein